MKRKKWGLTLKEFLVLALVAIVVIAAAYWSGYLPWLNINTWTAAPADMKVSARAAPAASAAQSPASKPAVVAVLAPPAAIVPPAPKSDPAATPKKDTGKKVATSASPKHKKEKANQVRTANLAATTTLAIAGTESAHGFRWEHFGVDPYATSREEAMRTRDSAFRALGLPSAVIEQLVFATANSGEKTRINVGDHLDVMLSKGGIAHKNVTVAFAAPVRGMEYAASAEKWQVTWEGRTYTVLLPEICSNWSVIIGPVPAAPPPMAAAPPPAQPLSIIGSCPDVYTLKVNIWTHPALYLPGVERTHAREELEERFAYVPHVSREHGAQLRKAYAAGQAARSAITHTFRVSLIMTPESQGGAPIITKEQVISDVTVTGLKELQFKRTTLEQWDAIRVVSNEGDVTSPPRYHGTGLHELRFFNHLPRTTLGEWDGNPVPDCIMNEHWIE